MLDILFDAEKRMGELLADSSAWKTLLVDYHPPVVKRLWRQWGENRIYIHEILPCDDPLFHPHPWGSAVRIVEGEQKMVVGVSDTEEPPKERMTLYLEAGSCYEMPYSNQWHSVEPVNRPSISLMVSGRPNGRMGIGAKSDKLLTPLNEDDARRLFEFVKERYFMMNEYAE